MESLSSFPPSAYLPALTHTLSLLPSLLPALSLLPTPHISTYSLSLPSSSSLYALSLYPMLPSSLSPSFPRGPLLHCLPSTTTEHLPPLFTVLVHPCRLSLPLPITILLSPSSIPRTLHYPHFTTLRLVIHFFPPSPHLALPSRPASFLSSFSLSPTVFFRVILNFFLSLSVTPRVIFNSFFLLAFGFPRGHS